eukprot:CAMPEP_0183540002 /NCGR_PEP_ID=MMETSP0371-20130417/33639_1 /TAXON_ID=268820 /ORGANISM="Peridinium aciculiferum, Strain PAER-2" /LENGTH=43 /DNA_ID= /DNA_START= /DNA_END= /DNA_ORIENTATION=
MPMIAIMARRPLASSEFSFVVKPAWSLAVKTLKPKSPFAPGEP